MVIYACPLHVPGCLLSSSLQAYEQMSCELLHFLSPPGHCFPAACSALLAPYQNRKSNVRLMFAIVAAACEILPHTSGGHLNFPQTSQGYFLCPLPLVAHSSLIRVKMSLISVTIEYFFFGWKHFLPLKQINFFRQVEGLFLKKISHIM